MAKQNRNTLKGYFETGDIPTGANYVDLKSSSLYHVMEKLLHVLF